MKKDRRKSFGAITSMEGSSKRDNGQYKEEINTRIRTRKLKMETDVEHMGAAMTMNSLLALKLEAPDLIPGRPKNFSFDVAEIY